MQPNISSGVAAAAADPGRMNWTDLRTDGYGDDDRSRYALTPNDTAAYGVVVQVSDDGWTNSTTADPVGVIGSIIFGQTDITVHQNASRMMKQIVEDASSGLSNVSSFLNETNWNWTSTMASNEIVLQPVYKQDWNGSMYPSGYSTIAIILMSIVLTTMMITIVVGNMLVCIAIYTEKSLKTTHNSFIASLAVSDFLLGLVVMPFSLARELMGYWIFGLIWCEMWLAIDVLLCTASILNLCLISLDRYWSITQAVAYLKKRTQKRAGAMIVFVWIFAGIVSLPPLVGWKDHRPLDAFPKCFISTDVGYVLYSAAGSFYIPAVVMVFVYIRIFFAARSRAFRNVKRRPQYPEITNDPMRDKSTTTTTTTTTSFGNASPPDGSKLGSPSGVVGDVPKSPMKLPSNMQNKNETSYVMGRGGGGGGGAEGVGKDKNCNTSSSLNIPTLQTTAPPSSPIVVLPSGGLKKDNRSPANEKKIVTLGSVEFKHLGKNSFVSDHRELSEIYEDGEDLSQTQSSEMEETTTTAAVELPTNCQTSSSENTCSWCCPLARNYKETKCPSWAKKRKDQQKRKKRTRSKKRDKNRRDVTTTNNCIYTAADSERLKRKLARAKERRATLILGLIMAAFILCWLPFFTTYVVQAFINQEVNKWFFAFVFWLGYCNSALNPIIYTIFNRDFRRAFRKILFK